jgi:hypothetical protein
MTAWAAFTPTIVAVVVLSREWHRVMFLGVADLEEIHKTYKVSKSLMTFSMISCERSFLPLFRFYHSIDSIS